jgi:hypothetical protein
LWEQTIERNSAKSPIFLGAIHQKQSALCNDLHHYRRASAREFKKTDAIRGREFERPLQGFSDCVSDFQGLPPWLPSERRFAAMLGLRCVVCEVWLAIDTRLHASVMK